MKYILTAILTLAGAQALAIDVTADGLTANPWCEKFDESGTTYLSRNTFGTDAKIKQTISEIAADGSVGAPVYEFEANWVLNGQVITLTDPADSTQTQELDASMIDNGGIHLMLKDKATGEDLADLTACH